MKKLYYKSLSILLLLTLIFAVPSCTVSKSNTAIKAGTPDISKTADTSVNTNTDTQLTILKNKAIPNPTGLQFGFWANFSKQDGVLKDFGKRPVGRVDFTGWDSYETQKGVYDWSNTFINIKKSHTYGESVITCVNISFSQEITNEKSTIPDFYYPRITNPETRAAAKKFLYAYVQKLLNEVGEAMLCIDYEIVFNYRINNKAGGLDRAKEWSDWYIEAAETARKAAADMGKGDKLKLVPIVNGNPFEDTSLFLKGTKYNQWLADVVNASDYLGLDTYHWDDSIDVTDPSVTLDIIKFWLDNYSNGKEVIVAENGFTSVTENFPNITATQKYKYAGTEEQQRVYFKNLMDKLKEANKPDGIFHNKLRAFNIWSYTDNYSARKGDYEIYFGMTRKDGSKKPAYFEVKKAFDEMEKDPVFRPYNISTTADVTKQLTNNTGTADAISLNYNSGTDFEYLSSTVKNLKSSNNYRLKIKTTNPGSVILKVNNEVWACDEGPKTEFDFDMTDYLKTQNEGMVDIYFTSTTYPFVQQVSKIELIQLK